MSIAAKIEQCNENIANCYAQIEANEKCLLVLYREIYAEQQLEAQKQFEAQRLEAQRLEQKEVQRLVGTKLKWISAENPETYSVAVITKNGVLQVKSVTDGAGDCHDIDCCCVPCSEIYLGGLPPWRKMRPLKKKFFETESEWRNSLPQCGKLTVSLR